MQYTTRKMNRRQLLERFLILNVMIKYKAADLYAHCGEVFFINGEGYALCWHVDNSAPCANCAFFNRLTFGCNYPDNDGRMCKQKSGTTHGWNTLEYKHIPKRYIIQDEQLSLF